jgi:uncharacterized protein (DUF433 family)
VVLNVAAEPVPIEVDETGTARVGGTRLTLDTVVDAYDTGATPEQLTESFPPLSLADAYAVITYVLRHRQEVDAYMQRREEQAQRVRAMIEAHQGPQTGLRERLLARRERTPRGGA